MFNVGKAVVLALALSLALIGSLPAGAQTAAPEKAPPEGIEVIVVTPNVRKLPLWQISNGDNTLWILAYVVAVPKDIEWNYAQVEQVVQQSQEFISAPSIIGSASPLLYLNPVNIFRGLRLARRLQQNPDKQTLQEVVPPELYQRYLQLKMTWFPDEEDIEEHRPFVAGQEMAGLVLANNEALAEAPTNTAPVWPVLEKVNKLVKRNRDMETTFVGAEIKLGARYGVLAERAQTMMDTLPLERELECFAWGVSDMENREKRLQDNESRAMAWAYNDVAALAALLPQSEEINPCEEALLATSEGTMLADLLLQARQQWLGAVDHALTNNPSTFALLPMNQLLGDEGLLVELTARGYTVSAPE